MAQTLTFDDLPGWTFVTTELSSEKYRVDGIHPDGRSITRSGIDLELLLVECADDARNLAAKPGA
jgi:hypothetical protein